MVNAKPKRHIDRTPIAVRASCKQCGQSRLHRCVLVRMIANRGVVKTTCLTCGREVTG